MNARRFGLIVPIITSLVVFPTTPPPAESEQLPTAAVGGGQASAAPASVAAVGRRADREGMPLPIVSDLSGAVSIEAVLLPYSVVKRSFGKEIAEKYAVISLIIANRESKQGMILQTVSLDYSRWLFSGVFSGLTNSAKADTQPWERQNTPSRVASAEVRTVRTDFQDAQLWSARSWMINIATAVGATATSLAYATSNDLFTPSVAAFNGNVVPALRIIWPDNSQTQLNLLNDIAFRTNHVVPAKSSDIVIAFFPMERFLTPALQKIYRNAPAAFFNPAELVFEKPGRGHLGRLLDEIQRMDLIKRCSGRKQSANEQSGDMARRNSSEEAVDSTCVRRELANSVLNYQRALDSGGDHPANPCATPIRAPLNEDQCQHITLLDRISLNNIRVVIGGVMTIDVSAVPARISSITFGKESQLSTWESGQKLAGTMTGSFLSGGSISITGTDPTGKALDSGAVASVEIDRARASDDNLPFSAMVGRSDIVAGSKLFFTVAKTAQDKSTIVSPPFVYIVTTDLTVSVDASSTWKAGGSITGTINGTGLSGVTISSVSGRDPKGETIPAGNFSCLTSPQGDTKIQFRITIGSTEVPQGSRLDFTLSDKRADGSLLVLTYTVPEHSK